MYSRPITSVHPSLSVMKRSKGAPILLLKLVMKAINLSFFLWNERQEEELLLSHPQPRPHEGEWEGEVKRFLIGPILMSWRGGGGRERSPLLFQCCSLVRDLRNLRPYLRRVDGMGILRTSPRPQLRSHFYLAPITRSLITLCNNGDTHRKPHFYILEDSPLLCAFLNYFVQSIFYRELGLFSILPNLYRPMRREKF